MTSLFPHSPYAEDQPHSHSILYLHTVRSGLALGSILPLATAPASLFISRYRHKTPFNLSALIPRLLTHSARGVVIGSLFGGVATWGRMRGREEIEWQDRSWRLLESKGQVECDWWILDGAVVGAAAGILAASRGNLPMVLSRGKVVFGSAGLGVSSGVAGYMGWRYGINGGKFE